MNRLIFLLLAALLAAFAQTAVDGQLTVAGKATRFTNVYAFAAEGFFDKEKNDTIVLLTNGSNWLTAPYTQEISSGIVNMLAGRAPRDDTKIHTVAFVILAAVLAIPVVQLIILALAFAWRRPRSGVGAVVLVLFNAGLAAALLYALPRLVFGIPLTELVISEPDMGAAALLSAAAAALSLFAAMRRRRPS